ncbi:MAG: PSP1 C-terminal domain-containing protein, partial [Planctomycetota bacterium]
MRTSRGLEIGEALNVVESRADACDGDLLRPMSASDELLAARLNARATEAFDACVRLLDDRGVAAVLTDVELLFDGRGLYFHFLGEPPAEADSLTAELAQAYEATAQIGRFAETLAAGCGPGCGTEAADGG